MLPGCRPVLHSLSTPGAGRAARPCACPGLLPRPRGTSGASTARPAGPRMGREPRRGRAAMETGRRARPAAMTADRLLARLAALEREREALRAELQRLGAGAGGGQAGCG